MADTKDNTKDKTTEEEDYTYYYVAAGICCCCCCIIIIAIVAFILFKNSGSHQSSLSMSYPSMPSITPSYSAPYPAY